MSTATRLIGTPIRRANYVKTILWVLMALAFVSVLVLLEYPYMSHPNPGRDRLFSEKLALIPHVLTGLIALVIGPVQFSVRLRQRNLALHRILGKIYVGSIVVSSFSSIIIGWHFGEVRPYGFCETICQAGLWLLTTLAAFITARNRHIAAHRQWMIRSYALTFLFVTSRLVALLPVVQQLSHAGFVIYLFVLLIATVILPDFYFNWKELTVRRT
jgi:uncharacterized membrane protein